MQVRFSEIRGKEAYNGGGESLGLIINAIVEPKSETAYIVTMRARGANTGTSVVPISRLKKIDSNEIIFAINNVPAAKFPLEYDSFLSDRPNPGGMNAQVYSLNRKKVLGTIYDYLLETETGTRTGLLIEELSMGQKRRFLAPTAKAFRAEEKAIGVKKILVNPTELEQVE